MKVRVGHKLQAIREERRQTQTEFAELLGMSTSAYHRLERGETQASLEQLTRFAETLGVNLPELFPDAIGYHNNGHHHHQGNVIILSDHIHFHGANEETKDLKAQVDLLQKQVALLEEMLKAKG